MPTVLPATEPQAAAYDFGVLPLVFESSDRRWLAMLERRYPRFRRSVPEAGAFRIRFESEAQLPSELASPLAPHLEAVQTESSSRGFRTRTATTSCDVDLESGRAVLRGPSAMYPLDNLLVQLLPALSTSDLLFHAAALSLDGRGLLACGPSGAGKSTLARLAGDASLCDEVAGARLEADGFRIVSLPFWVARPGTAPLAAILLLEHGKTHALHRHSQGEAMRLLSRFLLWPTAFPDAMERVLSHLVAVVEQVPVYRLAFAPCDDVVSFLRKELA